MAPRKRRKLATLADLWGLAHVILHFFSPPLLFFCIIGLPYGSAAAYHIREPSGIHMRTPGLCHLPRIAGIHSIICLSCPLSQASN